MFLESGVFVFLVSGIGRYEDDYEAGVLLSIRHLLRRTLVRLSSLLSNN
jgi:hypothetical protein